MFFAFSTSVWSSFKFCYVNLNDFRKKLCKRDRNLENSTIHLFLVMNLEKRSYLRSTCGIESSLWWGSFNTSDLAKAWLHQLASLSRQKVLSWKANLASRRWKLLSCYQFPGRMRRFADNESSRKSREISKFCSTNHLYSSDRELRERILPPKRAVNGKEETLDFEAN